jgi:hypothetical protein
VGLIPTIKSCFLLLPDINPSCQTR